MDRISKTKKNVIGASIQLFVGMVCLNYRPGRRKHYKRFFDQMKKLGLWDEEKKVQLKSREGLVQSCGGRLARSLSWLRGDGGKGCRSYCGTTDKSRYRGVYFNKIKRSLLGNDSLEGFPPKVWGPPCWEIIHFVSLNVANIRTFRAFVDSIGCVLPCKKCRNNYLRNKKRVRSRTPREFAFQLHNEVSKDLGKRILQKLPCNRRKKYGYVLISC